MMEAPVPLALLDGNGDQGQSLAGQRNPRPECGRLRRLATRRQGPQLGPLVITRRQGRKLPDRHQILRRCCQHIPGAAPRIWRESNVANL